MKLRHHPRSSIRARGTAAALVACVLSLLVTPVALAEPLEGDLLGSSTATTDRSWEHRNDLEFLNQHDKAAQASVTRNADALRLQRHLEYLEGPEAAADADDTSSYRAQQEAGLRYLEQKAAAANGSEPAVETSADESGQTWLLGAGFVAAVAAASILAAIVRSRRQKSVTPVKRERDQVNV